MMAGGGPASSPSASAVRPVDPISSSQPQPQRHPVNSHMRAMVASARTCIVLTDSSKAGDDHLHRFADLGDVDIVITDTDLDPDVAAEIRSAGPQVVTA